MFITPFDLSAATADADGVSLMLQLACEDNEISTNDDNHSKCSLACSAALILVGSLMMINVVRINWADVTEAIPAFLSIALMPLTYSIAYVSL